MEGIVMSNKVSLNKKSPDFELVDLDGKIFRLSNFREKKNIILIFNRGFV